MQNGVVVHDSSSVSEDADDGSEGDTESDEDFPLLENNDKSQAWPSVMKMTRN